MTFKHQNRPILNQLFFAVNCFLFTCFFTLTLHAQSSLTYDTIPYQYDVKYGGKSTRVDANYRYILQHLVETMHKHPEYNLHIRGHVCCGPNNKISSKRAKRAYKYLIRHGLKKERMTHKGYSNEIPLAFPEKTKEDEIRNRRVDFVFIRKR